MNDIELIGALQNFLEHHKMMREMVAARVIIQPQRFLATRHQLCRCFGVTACKQCYLVPRSDQRLRQVRNHPLGASVKLRRNAFVQRCYLSYPQCSSFRRAIKTLRIEGCDVFEYRENSRASLGELRYAPSLQQAETGEGQHGDLQRYN